MLKARKCAETALGILQKRKEFKFNDYSEAVMAPVLTNPVMFNAVVEEIQFDDFLFDITEKEKKGMFAKIFK